MLTKHTGIGFLLICGLIMLIAGCGQIDESDSPSTFKPVIAKSVVQEVINEASIYHSVLKPEEELIIGFEMGGKIKQLYCEIGDLVPKGKTLAILEDSQLDLSINRAQQQVEIAQANLELANLKLNEIQEDYERKIYLYENGAVAQNTLEMTENQLRTSKIQVAQAQSQLNTALLLKQDNILMHQKTSLQSPINGVIIDKLVSEQQSVGAGQGVYSLGKVDRLKIQIDVPIHEIERWSPDCLVEVHNRGQVRSAQVIYVAPVSTGITGKVKLALSIDNPGRDWLVGELVEVHDLKPSRTGIFLPPAAIMNKDKPYVFVIVEENKVIEQAVELGLPVLDQLEVFGLETGSQVVIGGMERLNSGDRVKVIEKGL